MAGSSDLFSGKGIATEEKFTVEGSLTAGDPVTVTGEGKVKKAQPSFANVSDYATSFSPGIFSPSIDRPQGSIQYFVRRAIYDGGANRSYIVSEYGEKLIEYKLLDTSVEVLNEIDVSNSTVLEYAGFSNTFLGVDTKMTGSGSNFSNLGLFKLDGNSMGAISSLTPLSAKQPQAIALPHLGKGKVFISYIDNTDNGLKCRLATITENSISLSSAITIKTSQSENGYAISFDKTNKKVALLYTGGLKLVDVSSETFSAGSEAVVSDYTSGSSQHPRVDFDEKNNKVIIGLHVNSSSYKALVADITGLSVGSLTSSTISVTSGGNKSISMFDDNSQNFIIYVADLMYIQPINGDNTITGAASQDTGPATYPYSLALLDRDERTGSIFFGGYQYSGPDFQLFHAGINGTSLDIASAPKNFIGFAQKDAVDGATVKVTLLKEFQGPLLTNLSGLVPGSKYFIDYLGNLTQNNIDDSLFSGKALKPNTLSLGEASSTDSGASAQASQPLLPTGDKLRAVKTNAYNSGTDYTIANISAQNGGIFYGFMASFDGGSSTNKALSNLRIAVDGEATRTLDSQQFLKFAAPYGSSTQADYNTFMPLPIIFDSTITVTVRSTTNGTLNILALYSEY